MARPKKSNSPVIDELKFIDDLAITFVSHFNKKEHLERFINKVKVLNEI